VAPIDLSNSDEIAAYLRNCHPPSGPHSPLILDRLCQVFGRMVSLHSKVYYLRFDVRFPQTMLVPTDNGLIRRFAETFTSLLRELKRDPRYLWTREQKSVDRHQHYHFVLLLNGHRAKSLQRYIRLAEGIWRCTLGWPSDEEVMPCNPEILEEDSGDGPNDGLIDDCSQRRKQFKWDNGIMIRKDHSDCLEKLVYCYCWAVYLAKLRDKGLAPPRTREVGYSLY
jgi:hypothetical protein